MTACSTAGDTDQELGHVDLREIAGRYDYPHMVGHRASLANALYQCCLNEKAIQFQFSTSVVEIISFAKRPQLWIQRRDSTSPTTVETDVVLAADGIKSHTREQILQLLNVSEKIEDTGTAAYRIMLSRSAMAHDPDLLSLLDADKVTRWIGEKRHIIAYPIQNKQIYNMSTVQPDTRFAAAPSATYTTKGSKSDMLDVFFDFCPRVQKLLHLVPEGEVCEWRLRTHAPLPTWSYGNVALLGDACHPTLPHLAQGAAQAIEDAVVIAVLLSRMNDCSEKNVEEALRLYQQIRKDRAETLVELAAASGRALHLGQGEERERRDREFEELRKDGTGKVPDKWADKEVQRLIYGFDCMAVAESVKMG